GTPGPWSGGGGGGRPCGCGFVVERAEARTALCLLLMCVAITPPATPAEMSASSAPEATSRCLCRRRRASSRRSLERAFGSTGWRTERGVLGGLGGLAGATVWKTSTSEAAVESPPGPRRPDDRALPGGGPDRDRSVRRL